MKNKTAAFSLFELLFLLAILAILAGIALPVFARVSVKGDQTRALSNAKQIALAMRLYASDNDDNFPSYTLKNGKPTKTVVPDSNTAFAQLFPDYINMEATFWLKGSAFCSPNPPDEVYDNQVLDTPVHTLEKGENEWAYVVGLNDTSNSAIPFIVDGFTDPVAHTFSADPAKKGGAWKGRIAIVVHVDGSGIIMKVDQGTMTLIGSNGGGAASGDLFTTANSANGWLGPANTVVNPK